MDKNCEEAECYSIYALKFTVTIAVSPKKKKEIQRKKIYGNYPVFPFLHLVLNERTTRGRKSTRLLSEEGKEKNKKHMCSMQLCIGRGKTVLLVYLLVIVMA